MEDDRVKEDDPILTLERPRQLTQEVINLLQENYIKGVTF